MTTTFIDSLQPPEASCFEGRDGPPGRPHAAGDASPTIKVSPALSLEAGYFER